MPPKLFLLPMFCTTGLVSSKEVAQMYEKETYFRKLLFKQSEMVLEHLTPLTITFGLVTPKSIGFQCYPRWTYVQSVKKVGQGNLRLFIGNKKVTDWSTDRHVQSNMPSLFRRGGIKIELERLTWLHCHKNYNSECILLKITNIRRFLWRLFKLDVILKRDTWLPVSRPFLNCTEGPKHRPYVICY